MTRCRLFFCKVCVFVVVIVPASIHSSGGDLRAAPQEGLRFEVVLPADQARQSRKQPEQKFSGRMMVVLGEAGSRDPRHSVGETGLSQPPVLGRDATSIAPGESIWLDGQSAICPLGSLRELRPGRYAAQALLHKNPDLNFPNAPGDLYSPIVDVQIDRNSAGVVRLELSRTVPAEKLPRDTELIKYLKIPSQLLSDFYGRRIYLRAGIILPRNFAKQPERKYPLLVHIGGYAARFTDVAGMMSPGSEFQADWMAEDAPEMILVHLDGAGPLGDPYQIDSANHGPFGAAVTRELLPYVEEHFRGIGAGEARFLTGGSTGGWVSLALQIFYPGYFNGAWSFCPDSVDFRSFQLVNIYEDGNAYINQHGFERPSARDLTGDVRFTMRHECQVENVLGRGDSWTLSGRQWGAWNATYGARGENGLPVPLWDPNTGAIDHKAAEHWKKFDLRRVLESNWAELGPKLKGKLHIWVGEADDYFLNNAVHLLDNFLATAEPKFEGSIKFGRGQGHCWIGISQKAMMKEMVERLPGASSPRPQSSRQE